MLFFLTAAAFGLPLQVVVDLLPPAPAGMAGMHLVNPGATALAGATVTAAGLMFCAFSA